MRKLTPKRGSRECRVRAAPAVSCAKLCEETHTSIQVQRRQSGIPCAMVLRLMPCSPRRRIRLVTVAAGLMAETIRLDRISHRQLGTSNGCRDHTVLPYATSAVRPARRVSLTSSISPCDHLARRRCRVHRIPSRVRDDGQRPSWGMRWRELVELICPTAKAKYFLRRGWTGFCRDD